MSSESPCWKSILACGFPGLSRAAFPSPQAKMQQTPQALGLCRYRDMHHECVGVLVPNLQGLREPRPDRRHEPKYKHALCWKLHERSQPTTSERMQAFLTRRQF